MDLEKHIKHWASLCESEDKEIFHLHEDIDDGSLIGEFSVNDDTITEMGEVGRLTKPH